eukprot:CAMPEP_0170463936 /NCGR_PEP_ID=MMETSP0123-20130129/8855_1 /TAXON_ID=182087 /ORGANISM="Favella ehrenbergii, Strain Fehren 1" /LENGTH=60 /DNA_ID=CAMNT_0010729481 /DNA_START=54 /DNA_END=236 /DNA_ORIENTATION=+
MAAMVPFSAAQRRGSKSPPKANKEKSDDYLRHEKDFIAFDINSDNYVDASEIRQMSKNIS